MAKKSKIKAKEKKIKAQEFNSKYTKITSDVTQIGGSALIPGRVTINPKIREREEILDHYDLVFYDYNQNECELHDISQAQAKALINKFNLINDTTPHTIATSGLVKDNIDNSGPYSCLYRNLPPDIELKESNLPNGGRVFFYLISKYFCVVSIKARHIDLH